MTSFGTLDVEAETRRAKMDVDLVCDHFEPFLARFVEIEVSTCRNRLRFNARMEGLAKAMARALIVSGTAGKSVEGALDDIARLQIAFDDEMTRLHDSIQSGALSVKNAPQPYVRTNRKAVA